MARPGLHEHRKFKRLLHLLGEPRPHVRGYLELLWEVGYAEGNPLLGDATDVELAAEYPGVSGKLAQALFEAGFIDQRPDGNYEIHDLGGNAPAYVRNRLRMRQLRHVEQKENAHVAHCAPHVFTSQPSPAQEKEPPFPPMENNVRIPQSVLAVPIPTALATEAFKGCWFDYLSYRIESERPITPTGAKQALGRLAGWGPDRACAALAYTMAQGWLGVQEEKADVLVAETPAETPAERDVRIGRQREEAAARRAQAASDCLPGPLFKESEDGTAAL